MKIVFAPNVMNEFDRVYYTKITDIAKKIGLDVSLFELRTSEQEQRYGWKKLDKLWGCKRKYLMSSSRRRQFQALQRMKDSLLEAVQDADVLWIYNGANFHPEWLSELPAELLTVYGCFDDPESSESLSKPVAPYFDACMVGNIAIPPLYQRWGCKRVAWTPVFTVLGIPGLNQEQFERLDRPHSLVFCGEKISPWRQKRLDYLAEAFPQGQFFGRGWQKWHSNISELYASAQIGINLHNSTGPINLRTFELPAFGVMQICDNKCRLGSIYKLNKEVVGYDTFAEGVDAVRYYMDHADERKEIAWNGYVRYWSDYNPEAVWQRASGQFALWLCEKNKKPLGKLYKKKKPKPWEKRLKNKIISFLRLAPISNSKLEEPWQTSIKGSSILAYTPNPELGPINIEEKEQLVKDGDFFEYPNMVALNWTVASLIGEDKNIIEIGSGTGCFAYEASADPTRRITCLEDNDGARNWAIANRMRDNITYNTANLNEFCNNEFDLLVSIEVVEHIENYKNFLTECARISKRAIITTPNRFRNGLCSLMPDYKYHTREWSAGEFYYTLMAYWSNVFLYATPDPWIPLCTPCDINTNLHPLIAVCEK